MRFKVRVKVRVLVRIRFRIRVKVSVRVRIRLRVRVRVQRPSAVGGGRPGRLGTPRLGAKMPANQREATPSRKQLRNRHVSDRGGKLLALTIIPLT